MSRLRATQAVVAAGALAVCCGAAFATGSDDDTPPPRGQQAVQQLEPEQAASFGVLRRARAGRDDLPQAARDFVAETVTDGNGAAPALSRRARATPSGDDVFVIPARGLICTYTTIAGGAEGGGGCNRTAEAVKGFLVGAKAVAPGITRIVGLAPDGVEEVRLVNADGSVERAAVEGNAYVFETGAIPRRVEWGGAVIPVGRPDE